MRKFSGGCHCGAVRYEADTDLSQVISCNCSHCHAKGLVLTFVPADAFTLLSGDGELAEYRFNKKAIAHLFCRICGVESFARGAKPDGTPVVAINVRALDGVELDSLTILPVNGREY